jgi:hypothetical protein
MRDPYSGVYAKATFRVDLEHYTHVQNKLHHGQMTALFQAVFENLDKMIKEDRLMDIVEYIYHRKPLHLIPIGMPIQKEEE